jgi:hypothetical protein
MALHGKDDALRYMKPFVSGIPIPPPTESQRREAEHLVRMLIASQPPNNDSIEGRINEIVNAAAGLGDAEVKLLRATAPPRMPSPARA